MFVTEQRFRAVEATREAVLRRRQPGVGRRLLQIDHNAAVLKKFQFNGQIWRTTTTKGSHPLLITLYKLRITLLLVLFEMFIIAKLIKE